MKRTERVSRRPLARVGLGLALAGLLASPLALELRVKRTRQALTDAWREMPVEGRRSTGKSRGLVIPAPIRIVGTTRTGRTGWATGEPADTLVPDPDGWGRILERLEGLGGA